MNLLKSLIFIILIGIQPTKKVDLLNSFSHKIIESLKTDNIKLFRENCISFESYSKVNKDISRQKFDQELSDVYYKIQNSLNKAKINLKDCKIFEVRKPHKEYKSDGLILIRYYVILKNKNSQYFKLEFIDCVKTKYKYLFADNLLIIKDE